MDHNNFSNNLPLVSIGVASYNNSKYILQTLDSIAQQSYQNIELIIVDDFSKDNSVLLIDEWIKNSRLKIKFIRNDKNLGVTAVCNILLQHACGQYFSIFSSDDLMSSNKIGDLLKNLQLQSPDVAGVFSVAEVIDEDGNSLNQFYPNIEIKDATKESLFQQLAQYNIINTLTTLIKTDCVRNVGGFNEAYCYEDHDLWMRILYKYELKFIPVKTVYYRRHPAQMTANIFSQKVTYDKYRLLLFHYKKSKKYKNEFKQGLRRCLRAMVTNKGIELKIILIYFQYSFLFKDIKGLGLLFYYLFIKKMKSTG